MSLVPIIQFEIDRNIAPVLEVVYESAALTDSLVVVLLMRPLHDIILKWIEFKQTLF